MRLTEYEIIENEEGFVNGTIWLNADFEICFKDDVCNEYMGGVLNAGFEEIGYTEADNAFISAFVEDLRNLGKGRVIVCVKNRKGLPRCVDLKGRLTEGDKAPGKYEVRVTDLYNCESGYDYNTLRMWKYRSMLSLNGSILMEYDLEKDFVVFYRYVARKSIRMFMGTKKEFRTAIMKYADPEEHNLAMIQSLLDKLDSGDNMIQMSISSGFLASDKKPQRLQFYVAYDGMFNHHLMYGAVINMSDSEESIPYYMTTAGRDSATGLLNKRSLIEYTEDVLSNNANNRRKHYMVILDIDDFKRINDNYGHHMGDKAIQLLANTLSDNFQEYGAIGRFGGDEFLVLTDKVEDEDDLRSRLRMLKTTLSTRAKEELGMEKVTLSMGVSLFPDNGSTYQELFELADKCLYIAKEKGKNRYIIYRPEMHRDIHVGAEKSGISSFDEQSKTINRVVHKLFVEGKEAIEESLQLLSKGFDLDSIDVFYGEDLPKLYSCGKYPSNFESEDFLSDEKYVAGFDANGMFVLNNYENQRFITPKVYEFLGERNCMSLIQMVLPGIENPRYMISFNVLNRNHKWSDAEISNLGLFGTLVYESLKRKK